MLRGCFLIQVLRLRNPIGRRLAAFVRISDQFFGFGSMLGGERFKPRHSVILFLSG